VCGVHDNGLGLVECILDSSGDLLAYRAFSGGYCCQFGRGSGDDRAGRGEGCVDGGGHGGGDAKNGGEGGGEGLGGCITGSLPESSATRAARIGSERAFQGVVDQLGDDGGAVFNVVSEQYLEVVSQLQLG